MYQIRLSLISSCTRFTQQAVTRLNMSNLRHRKREQEPTEQYDAPKDWKVALQNRYWYWLKTSLKVVSFIFIFPSLLCLLVVVLLIEAPIEPLSETRLPEPPVLEGPLAPNDILVSRAERLFEGQVIGPESIVVQSKYLYTGTADGKIVQLDLENKTVLTIATMAEHCGRHLDEERCGRPLGMRLDRDGNLIVVDPYMGMNKINITSGEMHQLFPTSLKVGGQEFNFLNGLDIADNGIIYFTDSSRFKRKQYMLASMEGKATGRLLKHNPIDNTTEVLRKNLDFPNGVCLSKDNSYLLLTETLQAKVTKYYLTGPKRGQLETFAQNLPGLPDDITRSSSGGYWVAFGLCRDASRFNLMDTLREYPWIRKQLSKVPTFMRKMAPHCGLILELDKQGNIIRSFQDQSGKKMPLISTIEENDGYVYIGSFANPFLGRMKLSPR